LLACVLPLALSQCGANGGEPTSTSRAAIVGGDTVTALDSPVLYLSGPEGTCTATLIAPRLVVTARHCVAQTPEGTFSCTAAGDLVMTGSAAGQIGVNDPPSSLSFFTNAQAVARTVFSAAPDAVGAYTISTNTQTSCRDDLAFVVLQQAIPGVAVAPVRIDGPTTVGETVSVWGYGLTSQVNEPLSLKVRNGALVVGVGPDTPVSTTQLAPVRAVRLGPDDITCSGDSGGPVTSAATGAVIAVASLGNLPNLSTPSCTNAGHPDTTGPRLAAYRDLALSAFAAAGASPVLESVAPGDASPEAESPAEAASPDEAGTDAAEAGEPPEAGQTPTPESAHPDPSVVMTATGGSCAMARGPEGPAPLFAWALAFAVGTLAVGRRRP
jgi:Trypsin